MATQLAESRARARKARGPGRRLLGRGRTRLVPAVRNAAPALLGYTAVRAVGVLIVLLWDHPHGGSALHRLATMWDSYWYQDIASHGYSGSKPLPGPHGPYQAYAFFPVYPALIRLVHLVLPLSVPQAALLIAWAASLVAAWGIFAVAAHLYGRRTGVIAAVLWGVLPYAVVESLAYSELVFTAFTAWAMYAAVSRRWIWAAALSVLAGLTRPTAVAVAGAISISALVALVAEWRRARRGTLPESGRTAPWRLLLAAALAPIGFVGFVLWVGWKKHSLTGYFKVQEAWDSHFDFGRSTLDYLRVIFGTANTLWMPDVVVTGTLAAAVMLFVLSALQRQPLPLVLLSFFILVLAIGDAAYFNSRARFLLPAIGLLLPMASVLAKVRTRGAVPVVLSFAAVWSGIFGGYLVFVYTNSP
ncbi:glycosyltransferase family 39 protein [Streptomyces sp. TLI_171]|uniref:glycosyltransferase family 39 protein n=1 Tax=Streptomyces sp. TLI_171 TaxID=1938859 RepID=UPI000C5C020C|nr:glycosyltransferase family 39 protein [Streptomyces sp. TLI_171]RKE19489.1 dolichyl-phosphate-mannose-protein mannosyltransferase [Streptomyces sp. TLI_171]